MEAYELAGNTYCIPTFIRLPFLLSTSTLSKVRKFIPPGTLQFD